MDTKKRILTGDRPTGPLHLGHYVGSLANRVKLQNAYDEFVIIADVQALSTNFDRPERLRNDVRQVALDNLAVGLDPNVATLFVQSLIPEIAELTIFYSMFVSVNALRHNPTVKTEAAEHGYKELTYGFLGYPVSQAADITFCKAHLVPVGADQVPHVELTRKIVRRFNELYAPVFPEPAAMVGEVPRLVGLDGNAKMSKSLDNAIYLSDDAAAVQAKVRRMYTDPTRLHPTDPGHVEGNPVFQHHDAFNPDRAEVDDLKARYRAGRVGDVEVKQRLTRVLNDFLSPLRERRAFYESRPALVDEIIAAGTARARAVAQETMRQVRAAMQIDYDFRLPIGDFRLAEQS
ncbi:MAG: tryptophan--tRNA ligase [Chloroflexi bacterium]|nr:tryptophan--tRNA ligase [Chloroflexota bacterium]